MSIKLTESDVEEAALEWLSGLGYAVLHGPDISPEGAAPERVSHDQVLLTERLREALERLNPHLPAETLEEVLRKVRQTETPSLVEENRRLHRYLIEGVPVEVAREDGSIGGDVARLIDFANVEANDWLAVNQYTVIEGRRNRRPDVVVFINGLPLGVIEMKNPGDGNATLEGAFNQFQTYKDQIPSLFRTNAALVTSDGLHARLGSLTATIERFMPWRTVDGSAVAPKGSPALGTLIEGVFEKSRFLTLIRDFTVFGDTGAGLVKIVAGYHQFHAVRHAVARTIEASSLGGDRRIGVIWHTQGSGKSLLMAFYAGQIVAHPAMVNPTVVVVTDRNDLDDQLFGTFAMCRDLLRQTPRQVGSRDLLAGLLLDHAGEGMTPSHAVKNGKRYRYYASRALTTGQRAAANSGQRLPAGEIEQLVADRIVAFLRDHAEVSELIAEQVASTADRSQLLDRAADCAEAWPEMSTTEKRAMLLMILDRIQVHSDRVDIPIIARGLTEFFRNGHG